MLVTTNQSQKHFLYVFFLQFPHLCNVANVDKPKGGSEEG